MWAIRTLILALVIWGIWRAVDQARSELTEYDFSFRKIQLGWLVVAGCLYFTGMLPMYWFWLRALRALGQHPGRLACLRAFYIGHLGKYVPGKAMVVVIRTSLLAQSGVDPVVASVSVFIETLTMMAVGAFVAASLITVQFGDQIQMQILAVVLMLATGVPLLPPLFRRIVKTLKLSRLSSKLNLDGLTYRLMSLGFTANCIGWIVLGLSLWATLKAMPNTEMITLADLPRMVASTSLAMVAGFLSLLPGGVGVRELVLNELLAPHVGGATALASAVLLRLVWLATELIASGVLYVVASTSHGIDPSGSANGL